MRSFFLFLFSAVFGCLTQGAPAAEPSFLGVYSNETEGFHIKTLMLDENGKGYYFAAVAGVPVLWRKKDGGNEITITGPFAENLKTASFDLRFDPITKEFTILDAKRAEGSRPLHKVSDTIPQNIRDAIKHFDGTINRP